MNKLLLAVAVLVVILYADSVLGRPCHCGWTGYKGFCYHVSNLTRTRDQAQNYCETLGANLVKIVSAEENDFVLALSQKFAPSKKRMWIGLKRWKEDNKYHWTDGAPPNHYTNWAQDEPNFVEQNEYCVHMFTDPKTTNLYKLAGTWNDLQCEPVAPKICGAVCEKIA